MTSPNLTLMLSKVLKSMRMKLKLFTPKKMRNSYIDKLDKFLIIYLLNPPVLLLDTRSNLSVVFKRKQISSAYEGRFPFVRTGRPDHCLTSQFENKIGFFQEFLLKNVLLRVYYLGLDWSGSRVLIETEIILATGMVWPVSSDKWKAPLNS